MTQRWAAYISLIVVLVAQTAKADERHASLFGISLGEPLNMPACEMPAGASTISRPTPSSTLCAVQRPSRPERIEIYFAKDEHPDFVPGIERKFYATVRDGSVQKVQTFTTGLASQEQVLEMLNSKFGKPALLRHIEAQNLMGAKFDTIDARWNVGTDVVSFIGAMAADGGSIEVETAEQAALDRGENSAQKGPAL